MFLCLFFSLINKTDDTQSKKCHLHFTFSSLLWHTQFLDLTFKSFSVTYGSVFDACSVIIYGIYAVMQKLRYF